MTMTWEIYYRRNTWASPWHIANTLGFSEIARSNWNYDAVEL